MNIKHSVLAALVLTGSAGFVIAQSASTPVPAASAPTTSAPAAGDETQGNPVWQKFRAACAADVKKHCGEVERVKGQRGQMRACLDSHKAELSADCTKAIAERDAAPKGKKS